MVTFIKDIDLIDDIDKYDVILVGTNTYHVMGNGFQRKVRVKYPTTYYLNTTTKYADKNKLGTRVSTIGEPIFSLCFITHGYNFRPDLTPDYLDYKALESCIKSANDEYINLKVATTMIGCSKFDGNGNVERVLEILHNNTSNIDLYVYDYVQLDRYVESVIKYSNIVKNENYDRDKKIELLKKKIEEDGKLYSIGGPTNRMDKIKEDIKSLLKK